MAFKPAGLTSGRNLKLFDGFHCALLVRSTKEQHHPPEVYGRPDDDVSRNFSFIAASDFAKREGFDAFLAVGGGSVMDTCKAANLYSSDPEAEFLDYVAAPIGRGRPVTVPLKPMLAVPTTSGTGSETTGVAVFDYLPLKAKVGIASRALRPLLGLVDPNHAKHMPERVAAFSG